VATFTFAATMKVGTTTVLSPRVVHVVSFVARVEVEAVGSAQIPSCRSDTGVYSVG
jgi:hypothetical protein